MCTKYSRGMWKRMFVVLGTCVYEQAHRQHIRTYVCLYEWDDWVQSYKGTLSNHCSGSDV